MASQSPDPAPAPVAAPVSTPEPRVTPVAARDTKAPPILEAHNALRAKHCAPAMTWSRDLEKVAQKWADQLAKKCEFGHSGSDFGENLAAGTSGALDAESVARMWYDEIAGYDFKKGAFSMETGHFTQLVWKNSTRLGCGTSTCKGMDIWVCNYDPPGNVQGQFREQVLPTSCRK